MNECVWMRGCMSTSVHGCVGACEWCVSACMWVCECGGGVCVNVSFLVQQKREKNMSILDDKLATLDHKSASLSLF